MRSKPRKNKDEQLSCRKNSKSCLTAKTKVRMPRPFLRRSCASRSRFEKACLTLALPSRFAGFFLALLLLSLWGRAIPSAHLRMLSSHLSVTRSHLGIARHLIHCMGPMSSSSGPGSFAGMHLGLVSPCGSHVAVISGLELVPVWPTVTCCLTCSCFLKITFSYVPRFVSTLSRSHTSSESFSSLTLHRACALAIKFGCVPDSVFAFACPSSSCSPESLFAAFALPRAFALVE